MALQTAQKFGLAGMRDLVNFFCVVLSYGERLQTDPRIEPILMRLHNKEISMDQVMELLP